MAKRKPLGVGERIFNRQRLGFLAIRCFRESLGDSTSGSRQGSSLGFTYLFPFPYFLLGLA